MNRGQLTGGLYHHWLCSGADAEALKSVRRWMAPRTTFANVKRHLTLLLIGLSRFPDQDQTGRWWYHTNHSQKGVVVLTVLHTDMKRTGKVPSWNRK